QRLELGEIHLDAGDLIVPTHAHLAEAQLPQVRLEPLDLAETLGGDGGAVGDAARQAGRGRFVPDLHADQAGGLTHVRLGHARVHQRAPGTCLPGGVEPRAVVPEIVEVRAVEDVVEVPFASLDLGDFVELRLAVEAAIGPIRGVT